MHAIERCGQPYDHDGDWIECRLAYNHDLTCYDANRQARIDELLADIRKAKGPWL